MLPSAKEQSNKSDIEKFFVELRELHTDPYLAESERDTIRILKSRLAEFGGKFVVVAGLPPNVRRLVRATLEGLDYIDVEELGPEDAVSTIARADVGITWAEYGVVNQGALMEVVYDDAAKLASSLPFNHIAILSSRRLIRDLVEAMPELGRIIRSSPPTKKPVISFISGPSKTGDIEMKLLYGVHGPNTLTVLLLDWF